MYTFLIISNNISNIYLQPAIVVIKEKQLHNYINNNEYMDSKNCIICLNNIVTPNTIAI